jgi:hypothetical protein
MAKRKPAPTLFGGCLGKDVETALIGVLNAVMEWVSRKSGDHCPQCSTAVAHGTERCPKCTTTIPYTCMHAKRPDAGQE